LLVPLPLLTPLLLLLLLLLVIVLLVLALPPLRTLVSLLWTGDGDDATTGAVRCAARVPRTVVRPRAATGVDGRSSDVPRLGCALGTTLCSPSGCDDHCGSGGVLGRSVRCTDAAGASAAKVRGAIMIRAVDHT
jgi:hypothetical protein